MTPQAALTELLARVGAGSGAVLVSAEELGQWPLAAVAAMKSQALLRRARPAASVVCPGCERECVMPVHTLPGGPRGAVSFVVCDKRTDIDRVPLSAERLAQWRCDTEAVCGFIATSLELRRSDQHAADAGLHNIGVASGDKLWQLLGLKVDDGLVLVAGNSAVPLAELVVYQDGAYSLDVVGVRQLVDSATTADPRYTPSNAKREARKLGTQATYKAWQKAYRELKRRHLNMSDVWCSVQIAKKDIAAGRNADTIRKHLKK
jgi:hypothetical protein